MIPFTINLPRSHICIANFIFVSLPSESFASSSSGVQNRTSRLGHTNSQWYSSRRVYLHIRRKLVQQRWSQQVLIDNCGSIGAEKGTIKNKLSCPYCGITKILIYVNISDKGKILVMSTSQNWTWLNLLKGERKDTNRM